MLFSRPRTASVLVAGVIMVVAAGCLRVPSPYLPATIGGPSPRVTVAGESLVHESKDRLGWELTRRGYQTSVDGDDGRSVADQRPLLSGELATNPDVMVVALGVNDAFRAGLATDHTAALAQSAAEIESVFDELANVSCVVWVNVGSHTDYYWLRTYAPAINRAIRAGVASHRNARLADWDALSANPADPSHVRPDWFVYDETHFTATGLAQWSKLIGDSVDACGRPHRADPRPWGVLDSVASVSGGVRLSGWAIDPETSTPLDVHVYADGVFAGLIRTGSARPDVAAAFARTDQGFGFNSVVTVPPGTRSVCAYAIDAVSNLGNPLLGCANP